MSDWYRVRDDGTQIQVEFLPSCDRFWPPVILQENPLPVGQVHGRRVILTGPGAVWMYAHAAATFLAAGAREISVQTPNKPGTSEDLDGCESKIILAGEEGNKGALLIVHMRPSPPLSPSAIHRLLESRWEELSRLRSADLVLKGRASVDVYARTATTAVNSGVRRITCWSARDGLVVVYDPEGGQLGCRISRPAWLAQAMPKPVWPVVLGVVGDPNLGKSVFCSALDSFRESIGCNGWKLDCDGQSPTPSWYLSLVGEQRARELREQQKRSWTSEMELAIAEQLRLGRDLFSVLLADLPGGNHKVTPPLRIPPGRERIFAEVDLLILLDRHENLTFEEWRNSLRQHNYDGRIAAVLTSRDPTGQPTLQAYKEDGMWKGVVTGLDRSRSARDLAEAFRSDLEPMWKDLLDSARWRPVHG